MKLDFDEKRLLC